MDPYTVREDFPIFSTGIVYLDNAATSQKPSQVIEAISEYYRRFNSNVHRGTYRIALETTEAYEDAHRILASLIRARNGDEIVFGGGTTSLLNALARSLSIQLGEGDELLITIAEHHSNILPWARIAKRRKAQLVVTDVREDGTIDLEDMESKVDSRTRIMAVTHVSNVTGAETPLREVSRLAHEVGALLIVDGAQAAPHIPLDVGGLGADFYVFSGHKMLGPSGIGVMWGRHDLLEDLEPPEVGGGIIRSVKLRPDVGELKLNVSYLDVPWRLEAGTPNIEGAVGLTEAAKYLMRIGLENIREHEGRLVRAAEEKLAGIRGVKIVGPRRTDRSMISFVVQGKHGYYNPHAMAGFLSSRNIAVRSGHHCAQPLVERLGFSQGTVRASFYLYNTIEDVEALVSAIRDFVGGG